jgi:hypothetical protein
VTGITGSVLDMTRERQMETQQREFATQREGQKRLVENQENDPRE